MATINMDILSEVSDMISEIKNMLAKKASDVKITTYTYSDICLDEHGMHVPQIGISIYFENKNKVRIITVPANACLICLHGIRSIIEKFDGKDFISYLINQSRY